MNLAILFTVFSLNFIFTTLILKIRRLTKENKLLSKSVEILDQQTRMMSLPLCTSPFCKSSEEIRKTYHNLATFLVESRGKK